MSKNVLIYITELNLSTTVIKFFQKSTYFIYEAKSLNDFIEKNINDFDLIILDEDNIDTTIVCNISKYFKGLMIYISKNRDLNLENIEVLEKPLNINKLDKIIKNYFSKKVKDKYNYISYFIKNKLSNDSNLFSIINTVDKNLGLVFSRNQNIVHAEYKDFIGLEAWNEILKIKDGLLSYHKDINIPKETFSISINYEDDNLSITKKAFILTKNIQLKNILKTILDKNYFIDYTFDKISDIENNLHINPDIIIIDDINDNFDTKYIEKYKKYYFILLTNQNIILTNQNIKVFEKPLILKAFENFIEFKFSESKYQYQYNYFLKEYLVKRLDNNKGIKKELISLKKEKYTGYIYILNNKIIHSEFNNLYGEEAFNRILSIDHISLSNEVWKDPIVKTLNIDISNIIGDLKSDPLKFKRNILILDDDITTLKILSTFLSKKNFNVLEVNSTENALEILKKEKINIVISDINIPNDNGLKFLLWIKNNVSLTKVIMISGFSSEKIKKFAYDNGAIGFFEKPLDIEKILRFLEIILSYTSIENIEDKSFTNLLKNYMKYSNKKVLGVFDPFLNKKGLLILENYNVIYSQYEDIIGKDSFFEILKIRNLFFKVLDNAISLNSNLNNPLLLLLEEFSKINKLKEAIIDLSDKNTITNLYTLKMYNKNNITVLIVDDDVTSIKILSSFLELKGFYIKTAESAVEGQNILLNDKIDLVITDLNMPELNGIDFLVWIKQYFPEIKVILMTLFSSEVIRDLSNKKGAFYYFEKPVNLNKLEKLIKQAFNSDNIFNDLSFDDFIKVSLVSDYKKIIHINYVNISESAYIYIKNKKIIHVEYGNLTGLDALKEIFETNKGIFSELDWRDPKEITLDYDIELLNRNFFNNSSFIGTNKNLSLHKFDGNILVQKIKNESNDLKKLTIYEEGVALEIIIGKTKKEEAIEIMKKYSSEDFLSKTMSKILMYQDLSLSILFNDESIVNEMRFGKNYTGSTYKGIKIGDNIKKGFELYGEPDLFTLKGAIWKKISLFTSDGHTISSIRIRNN
jgi:DNA-binding response OmpR family regulator